MALGSDVLTAPVLSMVEGDGFFESLGLWFSNISGFELLILLVVNLSVLAFFLFRKHLKRFSPVPATGVRGETREEMFYSRSGSLRTFFGVEVGTVLQASESITPDVKTGGRIKYRGLYWRARTGDEIQPGDSVEIVGRDVLTLLVRKSTRTLSSQYQLYS